MDPLSPIDRSAAAEGSAPSQGFRGRASGTRRIVSPERNPVTSAAALEERPGQGQPPRWALRTLDGCWELDARLRGHLVWLLVAGATAIGGAVPLAMSWVGAEQGRAPGARIIELAALLLAGLTWMARCRPKGESWRPEYLQRRVAALPRRTLLDARLLRGAVKSLKLSILGGWALGAGIAGLVASNVLGVAAQLLGYAPGPVLAGLSLWSASLLLLSELLRWALRVQAPQCSLPATELALAAREFSPIVDLAAPPELESLFLEPTPVHGVMTALSTWRSAGEWQTAEDYATALQHHLWASTMPDAQLALRHRLGGAAGVADLVVDDAVLIDFQLGLQSSDVARVAARVRGYRQAWGNKPIVLVICSSGSSEPPDATTLDALVTQHELGPLLVAVSRQPPPAALTAERASAS